MDVATTTVAATGSVVDVESDDGHDDTAGGGVTPVASLTADADVVDVVGDDVSTGSGWNESLDGDMLALEVGPSDEGDNHGADVVDTRARVGSFRSVGGDSVAATGSVVAESDDDSSVEAGAVAPRMASSGGDGSASSDPTAVAAGGDVVATDAGMDVNVDDASTGWNEDLDGDMLALDAAAPSGETDPAVVDVATTTVAATGSVVDVDSDSGCVGAEAATAVKVGNVGATCVAGNGSCNGNDATPPSQECVGDDSSPPTAAATAAPAPADVGDDDDLDLLLDLDAAEDDGWGWTV